MLREQLLRAFRARFVGDSAEAVPLSARALHDLRSAFRDADDGSVELTNLSLLDRAFREVEPQVIWFTAVQKRVFKKKNGKNKQNAKKQFPAFRLSNVCHDT